MNEINIVDFKFNLEQGEFSLILNFWIVIAIAVLFVIIWYLINVFRKKRKTSKINENVKLTELSINFFGVETKYEIKRNYQNVEIAHNIYVELTTRKAALPIDEIHDVIVEIYNSWYTLFETTRGELKKLTGEMILNNVISNDLILLLTDILNKGLRPHLTEYQARFKKWYNNEIDKNDNKEKSPQEIQANYEKYEDLIKSMKEVNKLLIDYSIKLKEIIDGK
jgi:ABC-type bacteriocin/lantibiotic exporter with double-glycine peptidase domain